MPVPLSQLLGAERCPDRPSEVPRSLRDAQVLPPWGEVPINSITPRSVQAWVSGLSADEFSSSRVRQAVHALRALLSLGVRNRRLITNPTADIDLPKLVTARGHRFMSGDELHLLTCRGARRPRRARTQGARRAIRHYRPNPTMICR